MLEVVHNDLSNNLIDRVTETNGSEMLSSLWGVLLRN